MNIKNSQSSPNSNDNGNRLNNKGKDNPRKLASFSDS
jgi:hypothetical protein